ncbi:hypothetical protein L207DRAFT_535791 [Hyaloscypha variabilis F]|uniref:Uncharacterized protein n=1 Tax=Hyaloscypha variabilis (strain UAMH 11265 / GT02V1 / F) TaxID=1149755 RepID=A0A2J6R3I7_HYAVF|nr:hypothetical protein L207DRAFT_535791 [Hyaloscypha variabilis F]
MEIRQRHYKPVFHQNPVFGTFLVHTRENSAKQSSTSAVSSVPKMPSHRASYSSDSEDDMRDGRGPYYSNGRFYPAGSRPSRRAYSPPPGPRPSRSSYEDESQGSPSRAHSPPPSRSSYEDQPRGYSHSRTYSPPPRPCPSHPSYDDEPHRRRRARSPSPPPRSRAHSPPPRRAHSPEPSYARSPPQSGYSSGPPPRRSQSSSGYSRPPLQAQTSSSTHPPPRSNSPVPYTYDDEEPDTIPHAPAAWNNHTSSSTREQLVTFFMGRGFTKAVAEREVGKEFEAHAPQHYSEQIAPGPSRAEVAAAARDSRPGSGYGSSGPRPSRARSPSPERYSRYRESERYGSESPEHMPNYGGYAGWRGEDRPPLSREPPPFRGEPPYRDSMFFRQSRSGKNSREIRRTEQDVPPKLNLGSE